MNRSFKIAFLTSSILVSSLANASSVAVKNNAIFVVDHGSLFVSPLPNTILPPGCFALYSVNSNATDIVITGNFAVLAPTGSNSDSQVINISACLSVQLFPNEADANLDEGTLDIPCVNVNGTYYEVQMNERGNSQNWEVNFVNPNVSCTP